MSLKFQKKDYGKRLCVGIFLLLMSACASPAPLVKTRFFWPPPPAQPKIEYIDFYQTNEDVIRDREHVIMTTIFGKEYAKMIFARPYDVASDSAGRVYVTDPANGHVHVLDMKKKEVTKLENSRLGDTFGFPAGIDVDGSGQVFLAESHAGAVNVFSPEGAYLRSFGFGSLTRPTGLDVDEDRGVVYVVDTDSHRIAFFTVSGELVRYLGERGAGPGQFNYPLDIDHDGEGNLYVLDSLNARIQVFTPEGDFLRAFGERGTVLGSFQIAKAIAVSPAGQVYVTDGLANRIVIFDLQGNYLLTLGGAGRVSKKGVTPGGFYAPLGIDVDNKNTIWIVDSLNRTVHQFQFLDEPFLAEHPILPEQLYTPPGAQP